MELWETTPYLTRLLRRHCPWVVDKRYCDNIRARVSWGPDMVYSGVHTCLQSRTCIRSDPSSHQLKPKHGCHCAWQRQRSGFRHNCFCQHQCNCPCMVSWVGLILTNTTRAQSFSTQSSSFGCHHFLPGLPILHFDL